MTHELVAIDYEPHSTQFATKSWSARFTCPRCGKSKRWNLNFLGSREITCDGETITAKRDVPYTAPRVESGKYVTPA